MKRSSKVANVALILALAGNLVSCGMQEAKTTGKQPQGSTAGEPGEELVEGQGLYLVLPASGLPAGVDMVRVSLSPEDVPATLALLESYYRDPQSPSWSTSTSTSISLPPATNYESYYFEFGIKEKILMQDIRTGTYFVTVEILNSQTGVVHAEGSGTAKIIADKVAKTKIKMTKIDRGGLVIVLEDQNQQEVTPPQCLACQDLQADQRRFIELIAQKMISYQKRVDGKTQVLCHDMVGNLVEDNIETLNIWTRTKNEIIVDRFEACSDAVEQKNYAPKDFFEKFAISTAPHFDFLVTRDNTFFVR